MLPGSVLAHYNLGIMQATGEGMMRDCHTAVASFEFVISRAPWLEVYREAYALYKDGKMDQALLQYMWIAELGYASLRAT